MAIEDYVNNFHSKVYSRMHSPGVRFSSDTLRLESSKQGQVLFYKDYRLRFDWNKGKESVNVTVNLPDSAKTDYSEEDLSKLLTKPESLSGASGKQKKNYASIFSFRATWTHGIDDFVVAYNLKRYKGLQEDEIFEAFWYWLKPVLKFIQDRKIT